MRILAIDTTTNILGMTILESNDCGSRNDIILKGNVLLNIGRNHSKCLLIVLRDLLKRVNLKIDDIDVLGVASGPGSYTGIRIGLATLKGISFCLKKPIYVASTLELLAFNCRFFEGVICPILSARKGYVYTCCYESSKGLLKKLRPEQLLDIASLSSFLGKLQKQLIFLGDYFVLQNELCDLKDVFFGSVVESIPNTLNLAYLTFLKVKGNKKPIAFDYVPNYL